MASWIKALFLSFLVGVSALLPTHSVAAQLVMVEEDGCMFCVRWKNEIGPIYPKTAAGQFAPLIVTQLHAPEPEGVTFKRKVVFTPTFVLIENGVELERMEGYPGDEFFWFLLEKMLADNTSFEMPG